MSDTLTQDLWPDINDREKGKGVLEEYMTGKNIKYKPELKFICILRRPQSFAKSPP